MRRRHFDRLKPVCPRCRANRGDDVALDLAEVFEETESGVREGLLNCPHVECRMDFPIIDGAPLLLADAREYIARNLDLITARHDLSATMEAVLGDCAGPGSTYDNARQQLSSYTWDHYGDLDPDQQGSTPTPGSVSRCLASGLELLDRSPDAPIIDLGCAVGRTSFDLAAHSGALVLGVDLIFPMLGLARRVLDRGVVRYGRRRVGVVYDHREFPVSLPHAENVDFWICDATALPFANHSFGFAAAMNIIDCVHSPLGLLGSLARILAPGSAALLASPYDWSASATPLEGWIGGHSQRADQHGAAEPLIRALLTPGAHPASIEGLTLEGEIAEVPWQVRLHDRSVVEYQTHVLLARAGASR